MKKEKKKKDRHFDKKKSRLTNRTTSDTTNQTNFLQTERKYHSYIKFRVDNYKKRLSIMTTLGERTDGQVVDKN